MNFEEAKTELVEGYGEMGFEILEEESENIHLGRGQVTAILSTEEIEHYASTAELRESLLNRPAPCSILSTDYREQLVHFRDPRRIFHRLHTRDLAFGAEGTENSFVTIGTCSRLFIDSFRFADFFQERLRSWGRRPIRETPTFSSLYHVTTIRAEHLGQSNIEGALKLSSDLFESCFFHTAYIRDLVLDLANEWPSRKSRSQTRVFRLIDTVPRGEMDLPRAKYNSDILRYYMLGASSNEPVLQFLAFYQVLEYFFLKVADNELYGMIRTILHRPSFCTEERGLDLLIRAVNKHTHETDETKMLSMTLDEHLQKDEVTEFIEAYEEHLGEPQYTRRRNLFGKNVEVSLNPDHLWGTLAKTIKAVRNALVHSSDRYERAERHIPFSETTSIVRSEVPLLRFLADKMIVATSEPFS